MPATPLPPLDGLFVGQQAVQTAYLRILPLERTHARHMRILGYMMIHAPVEEGRADVARSINECSTDLEVVELGQHYFQYFVKYFQTLANKPTPTPSNHPSRPSVDARRDAILASIQQAPASHSEAKDYALIRDNYRCLLTGTVDVRVYSDSPQLQEQLATGPLPPLGTTECCHILPQFIGQNISHHSGRRNNAANVWTVVQAYGGIPSEQVNGPGIHHLRNILTLRSDIHNVFDQLLLWLDPVEGQANTYNVRRKFPTLCYPEVPPIVSFSPDSGLPTPDPQYLALHAACARVVHLSGAAEAIDSYLRNAQRKKVLSHDALPADIELLDVLLSAEAIMTV
ncbi:hypothetical protein ACGC1H_005326 [Rhizoctonia solani]|uniref:HNH nuclease domain-containing protein n=1 Tax=Rhizoctonia solani TaxID=456999 RepID=A0A8H3BMT6_9AGAM|nr:unnamed protein product [Rhizoctonia solani]